MKKIKRVNGQVLRKELEKLEILGVEYDTLQDKLDFCFNPYSNGSSFFITKCIG